MLLEVNGVVRLAKDIELRYTQSGTAIANFSIVSSEKFKSQTGEEKENVTFIDAVMFGRMGEIANQYLRKGSRIMVRGKLNQDQWTDNNGQKRSKHKVTIEHMEMLDCKDHANGQHPQREATPYNNVDDPNRHNVGGAMNRPSRDQQQNQRAIPDVDIDEDEIPF